MPNAVSLLHPLLRFQISQLIPDAAAGGVAESAQRHAGRLDVGVAQPQVALQLVEDGLASGVDAEVLEGELVVGDVGLSRRLLGAGMAEEVAPEKGGEEEELLGEREDERA